MTIKELARRTKLITGARAKKVAKARERAGNYKRTDQRKKTRYPKSKKRAEGSGHRDRESAAPSEQDLVEEIEGARGIGSESAGGWGGSYGGSSTGLSGSFGPGVSSVDEWAAWKRKQQAGGM